MGCALNFDPMERLPESGMHGEFQIGHDHHHHCDHDHHHHDCDHHDQGVIDGETIWFFTQPWAADWFWGKLLRDSLILLALAAAVTVISGRKT